MYRRHITQARISGTQIVQMICYQVIEPTFSPALAHLHFPIIHSVQWYKENFVLRIRMAVNLTIDTTDDLLLEPSCPLPCGGLVARFSSMVRKPETILRVQFISP